MAEKKQRPKFKPKLNLTYEVRFAFGTPVRQEHPEYGESFLYGVVVVASPDDNDHAVNVEHAWFVKPFVRDLLDDMGILKGTVVTVRKIEGDGQKTFWDIRHKSGDLAADGKQGGQVADDGDAPADPEEKEEKPKDEKKSRRARKRGPKRERAAETAQGADDPDPPPQEHLAVPGQVLVMMDMAFRIGKQMMHLHVPADQIRGSDIRACGITAFIELSRSDYAPSIEDYNKLRERMKEAQASTDPELAKIKKLLEVLVDADTPEMKIPESFITNISGRFTQLQTNVDKVLEMIEEYADDEEGF